MLVFSLTTPHDLHQLKKALLPPRGFRLYHRSPYNYPDFRNILELPLKLIV